MTKSELEKELLLYNQYDGCYIEPYVADKIIRHLIIETLGVNLDENID